MTDWGQDERSLFNPPTDIGTFDLTFFLIGSWLFHVCSHAFLNKKNPPWVPPLYSPPQLVPSPANSPQFSCSLLSLERWSQKLGLLSLPLLRWTIKSDDESTLTFSESGPRPVVRQPAQERQVGKGNRYSTGNLAHLKPRQASDLIRNLCLQILDLRLEWHVLVVQSLSVKRQEKTNGDTQNKFEQKTTMAVHNTPLHADTVYLCGR